MNAPRLQIAVVGHTNTGKTSLIRTLTDNQDFGEVSNRSGTTRQVTTTHLEVNGQVLIELSDSPGLENAPELIDWLEKLPGQRHDGPERIQQLLQDPHAREHFDHESRVLQLMLDIDVALYVIDAREKVLEKYLDELIILNRTSKPVLPVLNFTASEDSCEREWREALARVPLHTVLAFDAAIRSPATEKQLFEKLKVQLDGFQPTIDKWLAHREQQGSRRLNAAIESIADMLIDAAGAEKVFNKGTPGDEERALSDLKTRVRKREQACIDMLLDLYNFSSEDYDSEGLPLEGGRWSNDLFDPDSLRHHSIHAGKYAGGGASIGALFDISTGGLSLGIGTAIGTFAAGGIGAIRGNKDKLLRKYKKQGNAQISEAALRMLAWRQLYLLSALIKRGHGNPQPLTPTTEERWKKDKLPKPLRVARLHPAWSSLNPGYQPSPSMSKQKHALDQTLREDISTET